MSPIVAPLTFRKDPAVILARVLAEPWSIFLDSAGCDRYDIVVVDPAITLVTRGGETLIESGNGVKKSTEDPLLLLRRELLHEPAIDLDLPFTGGAVGYFGYDLGRGEYRLAQHPNKDSVPEMAVGIYQKSIVFDHQEHKAFYIGPESGLARLQELMTQPPGDAAAALHITDSIVSSLDRNAYTDRFDRIQQYLRAGDCYQVNLAQRFQAPCIGDPWAAYRRLRRLSPAPFGAFINLPEIKILCNSPERFLHVRDAKVTTRPVKGTRPRSSDIQNDEELARELHGSVKDRAENLMIVDLLRNDLSKTCASVQVPRLFELESYATVHHLVSTVTGRLRSENDCIDLLRGCLPGGSVTGAPKRRAMEIIDELEPVGRGVYCGAIGYIGFDGSMDTNIAIRTLVCDEHGLRFWAGGGIVADSECEAEYSECLTKASALIRTVADEDWYAQQLVK